MQRDEYETFDIQAIMAEIKKRAKERSFEGIPGFEEFGDDFESESEYDYWSFREESRNLHMNYAVSTETPFPANGIKGFLKKVIRKVNRFWAAPMAAQQTSFNQSVAKGFDQLDLYIRQQSDRIASLEQKLQELEMKVDSYKQEVHDK